jgi:hypothetical protein
MIERIKKTLCGLDHTHRASQEDIIKASLDISAIEVMVVREKEVVTGSILKVKPEH